MKKFVLLIIFVLSGFSFAQTSKDVITYPINVKYLNSLVLETCNQRTASVGILKQSNQVTFKCAEYQSAYQSKYSICTHDNDKYFRGQLLSTMVNRREFFNKPVELMGSMSEVCTFATFTYGVTTYGDLSNHILDNFFSSPPHKKTIFNNYPYGNFACTYGKYEGFEGVYVTGFFSR